MNPCLCLSCRRQGETFDVEIAGFRYNGTVGFSPAAAFISNQKVGNASDVVARDTGILISLLVQYGCTAETIANFISSMATSHRVGCGEVATSRSATVTVTCAAPAEFG